MTEATEASGAAAQGFPAFPAGRRGGRGFARSWWGRAWIASVEDAALDLQALKSGRKYAFTGRVGSITVSPGRLSAPVYGEADTYRTTVALQPLTDAQWDRFLAQVAARAGHIAALLDRDMPPDLVAAAEDVDVPLLPGIGDLDPDCDCEDWGHPCRHAAALAYQAAWLIDEDPFLLMLLRGRGEAEFIAALQLLSAGGRPADSVADGFGAAAARTRPTVSASDAYASYADASIAALPPDPELPDSAGEMPAIPASDAFDTALLRILARDAARRAYDLMADAGSDAAWWLDERADAVRLAATHADALAHTDAYDRLREGHDRPADFPRAVAAWTFGGAAGLAVLDHAWTPSRTELAHAKAELSRLDDEPGAPDFRTWRNRWTDEPAGVQLRLSPDGHWHPYRLDTGTWWPAAAPAPDPATALAAT
ncbi:SWIM zinc finger family protein [Yinghuangia soli]|uniref:SWIM zinc finger family protein n=1 Tax=Yinghuangia soli TaxID=2908204 RepID=A0AA41Q0D0_9ACTN|nr:SWIM zinc finger family protein [Yinghuangia soli]MCF2529158.1 SWIM zinc finger family protein [Yinghuangia soli]